MGNFMKYASTLAFAMALTFPVNALAKNDIEKMLTNGKLVINSVQPTNINESYYIFENVGEKWPGYYIDSNSCNQDYSNCDLIYQGKKVQSVDITYNYDKDVKKVVDNLVKNLNGKELFFELRDYEFINYYLNGGSMASNSSEFKKMIGYKNFDVDIRAGSVPQYITVETSGTPSFKYNNTIYYLGDFTTFKVENVIYIDENTTNIEKYVIDKLSKIYPDYNIDVTLDESITTSAFKQSYYDEMVEWYNRNEEHFKSIGFATSDEYASSIVARDYGFLENAEEEWYILNFTKGELGDEIPFVVVKDSKKASERANVITNDAKSDISISTSSLIPLDTLIQVSKLTSGEEYEKIVKTLNVSNSEIFDLKLFSKSSDNFITKLNNGTFEVKIPISDKLKNKKLAVYYIDENDKVITYDVTEKDGYAIFNTDHFSIYTLAEVNNEEKNPNTGDNIIMYLITATLSGIGILFGTRKIKNSIK